MSIEVVVIILGMMTVNCYCSSNDRSDKWTGYEGGGDNELMVMGK